MNVIKYVIGLISAILSIAMIVVIIVVGIYTALTGKVIYFSSHYPFVNSYELPKDSSWAKEEQLSELKRVSLNPDTSIVLTAYAPKLIRRQVIDIACSGVEDTLVRENNQLIKIRTANDGILYVLYKNKDVENALLKANLLTDYCFEITYVNYHDSNKYPSIISFVMRKMGPKRR